MRRGPLGLLIALAMAAPAQGATYCVDDPACPEGGVAMATPEDAATAMAASAEDDVTLLGAGRWQVAGLAIGGADRMTGAGMGESVLSGDSGGAVVSVYGQDDPERPATLSDLTVEPRDGAWWGIDADFGALVERVEVDGTSMTTRATGVQAGFDATFRDGRIAMPGGVGATNGITLEDSVVEAAVGVREGDYGATVRRTLIRATEVGLHAQGFGIEAHDSAVHARGAGSVGALSDGSSETWVSTLTLRNVTLYGDGATGVEVRGVCNRRYAGLDAHNVAIGGFATHIRRVQELGDPEAGECGATSDVRVTRSAYHPARVENSGPGTFALDAPVATRLGLIDPAGGDLRPRWNSPLIDAGAPPASDADLRGLPRVGPPDVGAYEYQFAAPVASAVATPASGGAGDTFTFDASASTDVDGDPLTFAWTFDEGPDATGAIVRRRFSAGEHTGAVTVTDPTGRSDTASASVVATRRGGT